MNAKPFINFPLTDFTIKDNRDRLVSALSETRSTIAQGGGLVAHPIIDGIEYKSEDTFQRFSPSDHSFFLGTTFFATNEHAQQALEICSKGFVDWRQVHFGKRAEIIAKVGDLIAENHAFLTSLLILEAGKPFKEADADVAEAIDFCHFYALEMKRLGEPRLTQNVLGEENFYHYQPRGVVVVISPWNFPLAIACGMTVAALVSGNTTILKPSEQTSLVGYHLARLILQAGVPTSAFSFLPGRGEVVGDFLVKAPQTSMIVFTGSRDVGCSIIRSASQIQPGQRSLKRVIAELGGKNAIIVDDDADSDEALKGILHSAFGYSGQKCSACSRLIVVGDKYEDLLQRLTSATRDIIIGRSTEPSTSMGPVIDEESFKRLNDHINRENAQLLCKGSVPEDIMHSGWFVPPTIFRDVDPSSPLWNEELFGPVLACLRVETFEEALACASDSDYALTGGIFSRSPKNIQHAKDTFPVGNLYINRSITGALVERQPFGGFKFSGVGSKAGGTDYLVQFMEPRTITENTMRKGYSPDIG
jgi:RHH-type transcriptional regulator, proline utilization regulon repressor / proline dehydrogenase / delta 1-pyrroline-5-carboxylate dehydrogenase